MTFTFFRILEFEPPNLSNGNKHSTCEVELWDCAGDFKYVDNMCATFVNPNLLICVQKNNFFSKVVFNIVCAQV